MIIDGLEYAKEIKSDLKKSIADTLVKPCLSIVVIGDDERSNVYIKAKEKACEEVGVYLKIVKLNETTKEIEVINKIKELNNDEYVNGIIVQLPIPKRLNKDKIINTIDKHKDVDGLTLFNSAKLYKNSLNLAPCTPLGIMEMIKRLDLDLSGSNVVVVGRSEIVGKPLAVMLINAGATVTVCNSKTKNLNYYTKNADILISAAGVKHLITKDMVKENSYIFDVGITKEDKIYGDVDYENIIGYANVTPMPYGTGPMTVAMLLSNTIGNYQKNQ